MVKISGIAGGEKVIPVGTDLIEIEEAGGTSYYERLVNVINALAAAGVMARITGSTFSTIQHMQDVFHSTGITDGGGITDDTDGTITVAAGTGLIRATDSDVAEIVFTDWVVEAGANVALIDNDMNYLYVEYNAGSPQVVATITPRTDTNTNIKLGTVYRDGTTLHITEGTSIIVVDHAAKMELRLQGTMPFARVSGGILSEIGTRNIAVTEGSWWEGLLPFTTPALDTSVAGTFTYYYSNGAGGFTAVASSTQIDNLQYDDDSGTLVTLSNNKYGVHWIYAAQDSEYYAMYGTIDGTLTEAQDAGEPASLPPHFAESHARLIGKIIILKSASTFQSVQSAFNQTFSLSAASDHGGLIGLGDDDHTQYMLADGSRILTDTLKITEQAAAAADVAGNGQLWVKNTTPNGLWFTDDAGTDVQLGQSGGLANVVEDTTPQLGGNLDGQGFDQTKMGTISMTEQAAANPDVAGDGQFWVKTATPNELWFTDDAGTDFQISGVEVTGTSGQIVVYDVSGILQSVAMSGAVAIDNVGATTVPITFDIMFDINITGGVDKYRIHTKTKFAYTIDGINGCLLDIGTATVGAEINTTDVTGMEVSATTTEQTTEDTPTGADSVAIGNNVSIDVRAVASSPTRLTGVLHCTRILS